MARASALLTAWNPEEFGIIDKNVCIVIYGEEKKITPELYVEYIKKLRKLKQNHKELKNCAIRQIELAIWHYYRIQEQGTARRKK